MSASVKKSGLTPLWTKQQVHGLFERLQERADEAVKMLLARAGEEFITLARGISTYKNRTGCLRNSTGYAVFKDGVRVMFNFYDSRTGTDGDKGITAGEQLASKVGRTHSKGYVLVCVAGMNYAAAVEAKGYDVITHSADKAEDFLMSEATNLLRALKL